MTTLLFYKGTKAENEASTFWDRFICFVTRSKFSHVELVLEDHGNGLYKCISASTRDNGVRIKVIDIASGHWVISNSSLQPNTVWLKSQIGKKYDSIGLLGTVINLPIFSSKTKWFCSELIASELKDSWRMTPEKIFKRK
jgi:hypothetical protein